MSLKDKISRLEQADIHEDTIVKILNISHRAYRQHTALTPSQKLSFDCKMELKYSDLVEEYSLHEIARLYHTTYNQIHLALYQKFAQKRKATKDAILAHLIEYDDTARTKKHFSLSEKDFHDYLKALGWVGDRLAKYNYIASFIEENPDLTYQEIAEFFSTSKSMIAKIAAESNIKRQEQHKLDWQKVLDYAQEHGVTSAASHFNVSRAIIYYRRNKHAEED